MKVLVTYRSATGNTQKIAEAIFGEIQVEKEIKPQSEVDSLEGFDFAFVGFPIEATGPGPETVKWLGSLGLGGRRIALFITHGAPEEAPDVQGWLEKCRAAAAGAEIVDLFHCMGSMSDMVIGFLMQSGIPEWEEGGRQAQELKRTTPPQPDDSRLEKARAFAREVMATLG